MSSQEVNEVGKTHDDSPLEAAIFSSFVNIIPGHFFYQHDTEGVFNHVTPNVKQVLGYTPEDFKKHYSTYLTDSLINELVLEYTERCIRGEQQEPYEVEIFAHDGSVKRLRVTEIPVFDGKEVIGVQGLAQDITLQKRLEEQAIETEKARLIERLSAGIAHDWGNSQHLMTIALEKLLDDLGNNLLDPGVRQSVKSLKNGLESNNSLIEQLKNLSGQMDGEQVNFDLDHLLSTIVETYRLRNDPNAISIVYKNHINEPKISADKGRFTHVMHNLILNAIDAMGEMGKITIQLDYQREGILSRDTAVIRVDDTGPGIPLEDREKVFDLFYTTKGKGTGIGLAISKKYVESLGGKMVLNETYGGASFSIYIPLIKEAETREFLRNPPKVLVVDDNEDILRIVEKSLKQDGFEAYLATSLAETKKIIKEQMPDIVVLDVSLPDGNSLSHLEMMMSLSDAQFIISSGYGSQNLNGFSREVGFLPKPYSLANLRSMLYTFSKDK